MRTERRRVGGRKAERQKTERQKTERQKTERQNTERQNTERQKTERQKTEGQKTERQKSERQKTERQKTERQKTERQKVERQKTERQKTERQKTERQKTERQKTERQKTERQKSERQETESQSSELRLRSLVHTVYSVHTAAMTASPWKKVVKKAQSERQWTGTCNMESFERWQPATEPERDGVVRDAAVEGSDGGGQRGCQLMDDGGMCCTPQGCPRRPRPSLVRASPGSTGIFPYITRFRGNISV